MVPWDIFTQCKAHFRAALGHFYTTSEEHRLFCTGTFLHSILYISHSGGLFKAVCSRLSFALFPVQKRKNRVGLVFLKIGSIFRAVPGISLFEFDFAFSRKNGPKKRIYPCRGKLGISKSAVSKWKKGGTPSDATLFKLSQYFNCSIEDLKKDENEKSLAPPAG